MSVEECSKCNMAIVYRDHWKKLSIKLMQTNTKLEKDRDFWKRIFLDMYEANAGVTDEMMFAYRKARPNTL